jgi:Heterokaryon incompatibility protein (HET)
MLKSTRAKVEEFQRGLPMDFVSPTFYDAMEATRQLGFRYLWIDSLCIIQDDPEELKLEIENMGNIFRRSSCTIAAIHAWDGAGKDRGLFFHRDSDPLAVKLALPYTRIPLPALSQRVFKIDSPCFIWKLQWLKDVTLKDRTQRQNHTVILRPRATSLPYSTNSEWYKRGWIFQERILSRRIIYYSERKLYWSCFGTTGDEEGGDPEEPFRICVSSPISSNTNQLSTIWRHLLSDYVHCNFSHKKDRLLAIKGISHVLGTALSRIHTGIAEDKTGDCLLWYTDKAPLAAIEGLCTPSWTWAYLDGPVSFSLPMPKANPCSLIQGLNFQSWSMCKSAKKPGHYGDACVSGLASFTCPVGKLYRGEILKDIQVHGYQSEPLEDEGILRSLLGSAADQSGFKIPRFDQNGTMIPKTRNMIVPDHTELLVDECGCVLGFFIPDMDREGKDNMPILCAGVKLWRSHQRFQDSLPTRIFKHENMLEESIDILGLKIIDKAKGIYQRVGCGRVICNSWLHRSECKAIHII